MTGANSPVVAISAIAASWRSRRARVASTVSEAMPNARPLLGLVGTVTETISSQVQQPGRMPGVTLSV